MLRLGSKKVARFNSLRLPFSATARASGRDNEREGLGVPVGVVSTEVDGSTGEELGEALALATSRLNPRLSLPEIALNAEPAAPAALLLAATAVVWLDEASTVLPVVDADPPDEFARVVVVLGPALDDPSF